MDLLFTCSNCKNTLHIQEGVLSAKLTCPRCLAEVDNPAAMVQSTPAAGESLPPLAESLDRGCPNCGEPVELSFRYCPHCNENLRKPRSIKLDNMPDKDVRQDKALIGGGLLALGFLGGLGIMFYLCGGNEPVHGQDPQLASKAGGAMILAGLLIVAVIVGITFTSLSRTPFSVLGGVFGGLTIAFLVLVGILAWIVHVCAGFHL